jgi:lipopolysaccharide/colanic/teichoic acid biosynthesis glycosyltransferase
MTLHKRFAWLPAGAEATVLELHSTSGRVVKRAIDIIGSVVGLLLLSPLLATLGVAIKIDSRGPVFFRQTRVGKDGRSFRIWKLRTMNVGAELDGPHITVAGDPRVTSVGRVLRRTKLDELPQLLNVLGGEMSLVGPRPEIPEYISSLNSLDREVLKYKPGITDPASMAFRDMERLLSAASDPLRYYEETVLPEKIRINVRYQQGATVLTDFGIVLRTILAIAGR